MGNPDPVTNGALVSETEYRSNGDVISPPGSITEPKIAHGPVKSMSTTPRDSGNATMIRPLLGGFRGFGAATDPDEFEPAIRAESPRAAMLSATSENGTAEMKPAAADLLSNSLRFILIGISSREASMCTQGTCHEIVTGS